MLRSNLIDAADKHEGETDTAPHQPLAPLARFLFACLPYPFDSREDKYLVFPV